MEECVSTKLLRKCGKLWLTKPGNDFAWMSTTVLIAQMSSKPRFYGQLTTELMVNRWRQLGRIGSPIRHKWYIPAGTGVVSLAEYA
jgi:hypothetical protein